MTITHHLQEFSSWIYKQWLLLSQTWQLQSPLPPSPPIGTEAPEAHAAAAQPAQLDLKVGNENIDWASIIVAYCLASAIVVALSFHELDRKFSPTIHLFSVTISLCFASFLIRHFINSKFRDIARVLYGVGIFFAVTSFSYIANTIHFPLWLKIMSWLVYAVSFLLIFASRSVH
ncbi:hypothetical protein I3760_10G112700 [Carya illinoinensis]|nr:hypothetical protein I3760_10G112700 [Carya illinoinensis]